MTFRTRALIVLAVLVGNALLLAGGLLTGGTTTVAFATFSAIAGSVYFALRLRTIRRYRKETTR